MSKTLTSILIVAAAVAVNVIPGIGQAISGAILSTIGTSFAAIGIVETGLSLAFTALTIAGVASGISLLGLGPKLPKPSTTQSAIKTAIPPRVSAYGRSRLFGASILYVSNSAGTAVDVYAVHDGRVDAVEAIYLDDKTVTLSGSTVQARSDNAYKNSVIDIYWTMGDNPGTALAAITAAVGSSVWDSNHRGDGVMILGQTTKTVKAKDFQETFPSATVPVPSVIARWQRVYDWRPGTQSATDPTTWTWSENSILHLVHYMLVREGKVWAQHFAPTVSYWTAAANICDAAISLKHGGTEARYRSCLVHKHTDLHKDVKSALLSTCDGWLAPRSDGAFVVYAGSYYAPTVTIGADEIVSYSFESGIEDENAVNEIIVSYISAVHDYNTVEADPWDNTSDISARGRINSQPLENQVPSNGQARRLAKRMMSRIMAPSRGTVTTNAAGKIARGERYVWLTIEEAGTTFYDGPAEITQLTRNLTTGGITFTWLAADPNIDVWDPATEEGEPAPNGTGVAPTSPGAPLSSLIGDYVSPGTGITLTQNPTTGIYTIAATASGTVTSVSASGTQGVTASVTNPTTTPAITVGLGAITPTSVAATGTVEATLSTNGGFVARRGTNSNAGSSAYVIARLVNDASHTADVVLYGSNYTAPFAGRMSFETSGGTNPIVLRPNGADAVYATNAMVAFPAISTTASAANAFLNSGSTPANSLLRSTSSKDFKENIRPVTEEEARSFLNIEPVAFNSKCDADNPEQLFFGFVSEQALDHRPELVHWGYRAEDYDKRYRSQVLKKTAKLKPAGFMYDRAPVFHQVIIREHEERLEAIEHRLTKLEAASAT